MEGFADHGSAKWSSLIGQQGFSLEYNLNILNPNLL